MRRVIFVLLGVVAGAACGKEESAPTLTDCSTFLDHAARLEAAKRAGWKPMHNFAGGPDRAAFLDTCVATMHKKDIECALKASELKGLDECVDRAAIDDRVEAAASKSADGTGSLAAGTSEVVHRLTELRDQACSCATDGCYSKAMYRVRRIMDTVPKDSPDQARASKIVKEAEVGCNSAIPDLAILAERACACDDTACATKVQEDFDAFWEKHKDTKGPMPQAQRVGKLAGEMSKCLTMAMTGESATSKRPAASRPSGRTHTGIPACVRYVDAMEAYLRCDKVPQATRDAARQGLDAMKSSWGDTAGMPG